MRLRHRPILDICALGLFCGLFRFSTVEAQSASSTKSSHVLRGQQLELDKNWVEAEREFRLALQQNPNSAQAAVGHAEALVQIGQPFDAELELKSFLEKHPSAERAHEFYAVVALSASDDFVAAQTELETCVKLKPDDGMAWKSLGDVYLGRVNVAEAIKAYKKASRLLPNNAMIVASLADAYSEDGEQQKAEESFSRAIKMTSGASHSRHVLEDRAIVQYLYGRYLLNQNRARQSIDATTMALNYNPRSAAAFYNRARAYEAIKDYKHAEDDALEAFRLDPHDKQGPLLLTDIYRKEHDQAKAERYAEITQKMVDEEQQRSIFRRELFTLLGNAERALKQAQFQEAIPSYEELLRKLPTFYEGYFGLGMSYSQTGRLADAEAAFRKYLSFENISADGHSALGIVLLEQGRGLEGVPELEEALQIDPSLDEGRKALASEYMNESKLDEALRTLRGARDSTDPQLVVMLGSVLLQKGDVIGAKRELDKALALHPDDPDAIKLKQQIAGRTSSPN